MKKAVKKKAKKAVKKAPKVVPKRKVKKAPKKKAPSKPAKKVAAIAVTMVVDESGSMAKLFDATVAGFNEYVGSLKKDLAKQPVFFSALTFDSRSGAPSVRHLQQGVALNDAVTLCLLNYRPTGGTPLLDAVGAAIMSTEATMSAKAAGKAIVVIQTDGEENSSTEYNLAQIKTMIEARQAKGWQFVFIGAGLNAFQAGHSMGIQAMNTVSYTPDAIGTKQMFAATAHNTRGFATGALSSMNYTGAQAQAVGESADIWAQKLAATKPKRGLGVNGGLGGLKS